MKIKLIATGSSHWQRIIGYWGLSLLIDESVLFDTFCSYRALARKMRRWGVDEAALRAVVISHAHWDHAGGLPSLLEHNSALCVYWPESGVRQIGEGLYLMSNRVGSLGRQSFKEQALIIESELGLVIVVGCAHPGIVQMVKAAKDALGQPVYGVIGGLHLMNRSKADIVLCAHRLKDEGVQVIAPIHCTGWRAERIFHKVFSNGFISWREGQVLDVGQGIKAKV